MFTASFGVVMTPVMNGSPAAVFFTQGIALFPFSLAYTVLQGEI
jgi:hypothetical protein